jgi:peptidoglycan/LPS O-acetylase OafA/YrhL
MYKYGQGETEYKFISVALIVAGTLCLNDSLFDYKLGRFLCYLGNISYSTYLVHTIMLYMLVNFFGKTPNPEPLKEVVILSIYLLGIFIFSGISYKFLETGKLNSQLKKLLNILFLNKRRNNSSLS